jgi:hypothetical protein
MTETALIRIYDTPKGPHVYLGDVRVHHWIVGLGTAFVGTLGLIFDRNKRRRPLYLLLCLGGFIAFLDDIPDFVSFVEGSEA